MTKYKIDKNIKFKQMICHVMFTASLVGASFFGFQALKDVAELQRQSTASQNQIEIVTDAINPDYEEIQTQEEKDTTEQYVPKYDFEKLWETNPNIVAVIEGDCFEGGYYPIVSTNSIDEEEYYLHHSIDGSESSTGSIFSDYRSDNSIQSDITMIWGHNMRGQDGKMFGSLTNYQSQQYYENHNKPLKLYTPAGEYNLHLYSVVVEDPSYISVGNFKSEEEMLNFLTDMQSKSLINTNRNPNPNSNYLITCTCSSETSSNIYDRNINLWEIEPVMVKEINNEKAL